jgi:hypothetical protein
VKEGVHDLRGPDASYSRTRAGRRLVCRQSLTGDASSILAAMIEQGKEAVPWHHVFGMAI